MRVFKKILVWFLHKLSLKELESRSETRTNLLETFLFQDLRLMTETTHLCASNVKINSIDLNNGELPKFDGIILTQGVYFKLLDYKSDFHYMKMSGRMDEYDAYMEEIKTYELSFEAKLDKLILIPWNYPMNSESIYSLYIQGIK